MSPESLPVKLRQARGAMSLAEAAERSGVTEDRIRMYEDGERQPYGKTLRRLARAYGVTVAEWLAGERDHAGGPATPRRLGEPVRQRRRRPSGAARRTEIEVPVTLDGDEPVRLVLELVLKPVGAADSGSADGAEPADAEVENDDAETGESAAGSTNASESTAGPTAAESAPRAAFGAGAAAGARRRRRIARDAADRLRGERVPHAGHPAHATGQPDPLDEFRRAYSQFRQERASIRERR